MPDCSPLRRRSLLACLALAGGLALSACGDQGEGERCDPNNGPLDCETGLECKRASELNVEGGGRGVGLCCPPDGVAPSVDACRANATLPDEDYTPPEPVDAGDGGS